MIESKSQYVRTRRNLKGELRNTYERVVYKHSGFEKLALQLLPSSSSKPLVQTKWDCFMNPLPLFMRSKAIYSVSVRLHIIVSNQCFFGLHLFSQWLFGHRHFSLLLLVRVRLGNNNKQRREKKGKKIKRRNNFEKSPTSEMQRNADQI